MKKETTVVASMFIVSSLIIRISARRQMPGPFKLVASIAPFPSVPSLTI